MGVRNREAVIKRGDATFRDKQESLDFLDFLESEKIKFYGLEIVKLGRYEVETSMYKTLWFAASDNTYDLARTFIKEKMAGAWNYVEFKF
jgi:hypothetical protein